MLPGDFSWRLDALEVTGASVTCAVQNATVLNETITSFPYQESFENGWGLWKKQCKFSATFHSQQAPGRPTGTWDRGLLDKQNFSPSCSDGMTTTLLKILRKFLPI